MKLKTPNSNTTKDGIVLGLGVTTGGMLSKGVNTFLPEDKQGDDGNIVSKKNARIGFKAGTAFLGAGLLLFVSGNDLGAKGIRALGGGILGESLMNITSEMLKESDLAKDAGDNQGKAFIQSALGLKGSCGCASHTPVYVPEFNLPPIAMSMPDFDESPTTVNMYQTKGGTYIRDLRG